MLHPPHPRPFAKLRLMTSRPASAGGEVPESDLI